MGCAQGDFYHWVALFNYFDELLEKFVKPRKDLQLDIDGGSDSSPFPSSSILAILRVSATIMENCSNKHLYHSYEVRRRTLCPFLLCSCAHGPSQALLLAQCRLVMSLAGTIITAPGAAHVREGNRYLSRPVCLPSST